MAKSNVAAVGPGAHAGATSTQTGAASATVDFPPFDTTYWAPQIIWLAILFGFLYLIMKRIALPRVAGILDARRSRMDADTAAAEEARRKAQAEAAAYEQMLAEARARAQAEGRQTHARLAAEGEARRKTLEQELGEKFAAADRQIADTRARAMNHVGSIANDAAHAIVERLLGRASSGAMARASTSSTS